MIDKNNTTFHIHCFNTRNITLHSYNFHSNGHGVLGGLEFMIICTLNDKLFVRLNFPMPMPRIFSRPKTNPKTRQKPTSPLSLIFLNEGELVGGNVESVNIGGKAGVGLLGTVGAINSVSNKTVKMMFKTYRIRVLILTVSMS